MLAQLEMFPIVASIQRSRVDTSDPNVIVDPIHRALWREIQGIVFPSLTDASGKLVNKIADVDHLAGHQVGDRGGEPRLFEHRGVQFAQGRAQ